MARNLRSFIRVSVELYQIFLFCAEFDISTIVKRRRISLHDNIK